MVNHSTNSDWILFVNNSVIRVFVFLSFATLLLLAPCFGDSIESREFLRCYKANDTLMRNVATVAPYHNVTVDWTWCIHQCSSTDNYAAMKNGTHCYCSVDPTFLKGGKINDSECDKVKCNQYMPCGSVDTYAVFSVCKSGSYGKNCNNTCRNCTDRRCDRQGHCTEFCVISKAGEHCEAEACGNLLGKFGPNCKQTCNCAGGLHPCRKDTGFCWNGCSSGWAGLACNQTACDIPGRWGNNCDQECKCKDKIPCRKEDGLCEGGCATGWFNENCNKTSCSHNNGGCAHSCHTAADIDNTTRCMCNKGWQLGQDGKECIDIDECISRDVCKQKIYFSHEKRNISVEVQSCTNTNGSYTCGCLAGRMQKKTCVAHPMIEMGIIALGAVSAVFGLSVVITIIVVLYSFHPPVKMAAECSYG